MAELEADGRGVEKQPDTELPSLLVLGCGFAGYSLLSRLPLAKWRVTLLSPRNYFLFTPLLPSAVTGTVEFRSILEPARRRLRRVRMVEGEAESVDWEARRVTCVSAVSGERFDLPFERMVIAVGAAVADYGVPGVSEHALKPVSVEQAQAIRRGILEQFAKAEVPGLSEGEIRERLTFLVCGGGPTGIEVAAEIHDLLHRELLWDYPELAPLAKVVVVEALGRLLSGFDEALADYTRRHFQRAGIEVHTSVPVAAIEPGMVKLQDGRVIRYGLLLWAAGNAPVAFLKSLGEPLQSGRLVVDDQLRLPDHPRVYALGDCAAVGKPALPATAQVAQQQGNYLARALERERKGKPPRPFRFHSQGMLAYIGAGEALADLPQLKWKGRTAWLFWRSVYLTKLVSLANKVKVLFDWAKARIFGRDLSRF